MENQINITFTERKDKIAFLKVIMEKYHHGNPEEQSWSKAAMLKMLEGFIGHAIKKYLATFSQEYYFALYDVCVLEILQNMKKYDPEKSTPTTFFTCYIMHGLSSFANSITNKTSPHYSAQMNKVRKVINELKSEKQEVTTEDIARHTGMTVKNVHNTLNYIAMANHYYCGSLEDFDNVVTGHQENPEISYLKQEQSETLYHALQNLPEKDMKILLYRFGFLENDLLNVNKIAVKMGISPRQVKNSINRSLHTLRKNPQLSALWELRTTHHLSES